MLQFQLGTSTDRRWWRRPDWRRRGLHGRHARGRRHAHRRRLGRHAGAMPAAIGRRERVRLLRQASEWHHHSDVGWRNVLGQLAGYGTSGNGFKYVAPNYYGTLSNGFISSPTPMNGRLQHHGPGDCHDAEQGQQRLWHRSRASRPGFAGSDLYAYVLMRNSNNSTNGYAVSAAGGTRAGAPPPPLLSPTGRLSSSRSPARAAT